MASVKSTTKTPGRNWGQIALEDGVTLADDKGDTLLHVPLAQIVGASGGRGNDVTLDIKGKDGPAASVTSLRFFVPNSCAGYESEANPPKAIAEELMQRIASVAGSAVSGAAATSAAVSAAPVVGTFHSMLLSQPSGEFDVTVTTAGLSFAAKKGALAGTPIVVPASSVLRMYMLPVPTDEHTYLVLALHTPIKVGASTLPPRCAGRNNRRPASATASAFSTSAFVPPAWKGPTALPLA